MSRYQKKKKRKKERKKSTKYSFIHFFLLSFRMMIIHQRIFPYQPAVNTIHPSLINGCLTITEENEEELEQLRRDDDEEEQKRNHLLKINDDRYQL